MIKPRSYKESEKSFQWIPSPVLKYPLKGDGGGVGADLFWVVGDYLALSSHCEARPLLVAGRPLGGVGEPSAHRRAAPLSPSPSTPLAGRRDYNSRGALGGEEGELPAGRGTEAGLPGVCFRRRSRPGQCESCKMAAAAVEFQRAQSLLSTDREASIDILHSIGKGSRAPSRALLSPRGRCRSAAAERGRASRFWRC